jgi:hypothetical protein
VFQDVVLTLIAQIRLIAITQPQHANLVADIIPNVLPVIHVIEIVVLAILVVLQTTIVLMVTAA